MPPPSFVPAARNSSSSFARNSISFGRAPFARDPSIAALSVRVPSVAAISPRLQISLTVIQDCTFLLQVWALLVKQNYYALRSIGSLQIPTHTRTFPFWHSILQAADAFKLGLRFKCGNRTQLFFWHDCWALDQPLSRAFPSLFEIAMDTEASVIKQQ